MAFRMLLQYSQNISINANNTLRSRIIGGLNRRRGGEVSVKLRKTGGPNIQGGMKRLREQKLDKFKNMQKFE